MKVKALSIRGWVLSCILYLDIHGYFGGFYLFWSGILTNVLMLYLEATWVLLQLVATIIYSVDTLPNTFCIVAWSYALGWRDGDHRPYLIIFKRI